MTHETMRKEIVVLRSGSEHLEGYVLNVWMCAKTTACCPYEHWNRFCLVQLLLMFTLVIRISHPHALHCKWYKNKIIICAKMCSWVYLKVISGFSWRLGLKQHRGPCCWGRGAWCTTETWNRIHKVQFEPQICGFYGFSDAKIVHSCL